MTDWRFAPTAIKCFCSEFPQLGSPSRPQIDGAANSLPSERHLDNADEIEVFSFTEGLSLVLFTCGFLLVNPAKMKSKVASSPAASLSPSRILRPPSGSAVRSHC